MAAAVGSISLFRLPPPPRWRPLQPSSALCRSTPRPSLGPARPRQSPLERDERVVPSAVSLARRLARQSAATVICFKPARAAQTAELSRAKLTGNGRRSRASIKRRNDNHCVGRSRSSRRRLRAGPTNGRSNLLERYQSTTKTSYVSAQSLLAGAQSVRSHCYRRAPVSPKAPASAAAARHRSPAYGRQNDPCALHKTTISRSHVDRSPGGGESIWSSAARLCSRASTNKAVSSTASLRCARFATVSPEQ